MAFVFPSAAFSAEWIFELGGNLFWRASSVNVALCSACIIGSEVLSWVWIESDVGEKRNKKLLC